MESASAPQLTIGPAMTDGEMQEQCDAAFVCSDNAVQNHASGYLVMSLAG